MKETYMSLCEHVRSVLPAVPVSEMFFEEDPAALRLEMERLGQVEGVGCC